MTSDRCPFLFFLFVCETVARFLPLWLLALRKVLCPVVVIVLLMWAE